VKDCPFGQPLEWIVGPFAKPNMTVFEGREESERADGKLGSLQSELVLVVNVADQ
jgi:hypothetical protein